MAIDPKTEHLLTLPKAARTARRGKPIRTTIREVVSWATTGLHGVKLEVILKDGDVYTSKEAIARFHERVVRAMRAQHKPKG
jgi:hypothetical protein